MRWLALLALPVISGCIFCPDCGCYPHDWTGQWRQPELVSWAEGQDGIFLAPGATALPWDAAAAGWPDRTVVASVTYNFDGPDRRVTLGAARGEIVLSYAYAGDHDDANDGPRRAVMLAAVDAFLDTLWIGDAAGRQQIEDVFSTRWQQPDHYESAGDRMAVPSTWDLDTLWSAHDWEYAAGKAGAPTYEQDRWAFTFKVPAWGDGTVRIDEAGHVAAGHAEGRRLDETGLKANATQEFARRGMPNPTFEHFHATSTQICVD